MKLERLIEVPTGHIGILKTAVGQVEFVSLGDYGKEKNLKADFLGLSRDPGVVKHTEMMPLEEKWVITISTQYGCAMGCEFCDAPKVGTGKNVSCHDLHRQIRAGIDIHKEVKRTKRLNIHFARMGEPTWNMDILKYTEEHLIKFRSMADVVHPVVSTMMPKNNPHLRKFLNEWLRIKSTTYNGEAGLQLSINSTDEAKRKKMFNGNAMSLSEISKMIGRATFKGRKITLNFAVSDKYPIDAKVLKKYFNPELFLVKLTPMHMTDSAEMNKIRTPGDPTSYTPYKEIEESLKAEGYDVIVFIASKEEDESMITCGNAVLSGRLPILK